MDQQKKAPFFLATLLVGNLLDHYVTYLYTFLAPFLTAHFLPPTSQPLQLFLAYLLIPIGMIVRPAGSYLFGRISDRYGSGKALRLSLLGIACSSLASALLPTYSSVGGWAFFFLILTRLSLNFFSAGETLCSSILLLQSVPQERRSLFSSLFSSSTVLGILLSSAVLSLLALFSTIEEGWRLPYLLGSMIVFFTIPLRIIDNEAPPKVHESPTHLSWKTTWSLKRPMIAIALAHGFSHASYTIPMTLLPGVLPIISSVSLKEALLMSSPLLLLDICTLPLFALIAKRVGEEKWMITTALFTGLCAPFLFYFLQDSSWEGAFFLRICFVLLGVSFSATFYSWSQTKLPSGELSSLLGVATSLGAQLFGGATAPLTLWLLHHTGSTVLASIYWMILAWITAATMIYSAKKSKNEGF